MQTTRLTSEDAIAVLARLTQQKHVMTQMDSAQKQLREASIEKLRHDIEVMNIAVQCIADAEPLLTDCALKKRCQVLLEKSRK